MGRPKLRASPHQVPDALSPLRDFFQRLDGIRVESKPPLRLIQQVQVNIQNDLESTLKSSRPASRFIITPPRDRT